MDQSQLDPDDFVAGRVHEQLTEFTRVFRELGEAGILRRVLEDKEPFSGPYVQQAPENFTEKYLVEPVLHALEYYDRQSEAYHTDFPHFIPQPSTFDRIESYKPDYRLVNVSDSIECIVEVKAINKELASRGENSASAQIERYLESNTFCSYILDQNRQYLLGIPTDGLRWSLRAKDVRQGSVLENEPSVDLSPVVTSIARREGVIPGNPHFSRTEEYRSLKYNFVQALSARNLPNSIERL